MRYFALRCMFELLWATSIARLAAKRSECRGIILTLHRVLPDAPADFSPNSILQITPKFLEKTINGVRRRGFEIVDLDEAKRRVLSLHAPGRFVVLTFDDAYRDNLDHALPILRRLKCPFTLFVPTGLVDGVGEVWWQALEDIIAGQQSVAVDLGEGNLYLSTRTLGEKNDAYSKI
ncbi:MAG: polysaccharide deacetylase family protein, partial [Alphaproteobacteria bacterium]|nr:polysaccharide deacetylase family protein [Alphaproteobacteria bacterium]